MFLVPPHSITATLQGPVLAYLHTMGVLQADQADLLKELDEGNKVKADNISELPISPSTPPKRASAVYGSHGGHGEAPLVGPVRYEGEGLSLPPRRPASAFWPVQRLNRSVSSVVDRYQEARKQVLAFQ
ncbi:hypothetical protein M9458_021590, partial [Cirrhinus mrigala]